MSSEEQGPGRDPGDTREPSCCSRPREIPATLGRLDRPWVDGVVQTPLGEVPRVATRLSARDRAGALRVRCGIGRDRYRVPPGLYAVGDARPGSPVLLTASYKLSFDHLRRALAGRDAWILVLDTRGINVWCAAGKGTFGTDEVVRKVRSCGLERIVSHHRLVCPQLGASGVSAHLVHERCGFSVIFGPILARDIPAFLDAGMKASESMRRVRFGLSDRATLVPVEIVNNGRYALLGAIAFLLLGGFSRQGYSLDALRTTGLVNAVAFLALFVASAALGPILLPWLPGRAFSLKGAALGILLVGAAALAVTAAGPFAAATLAFAAGLPASGFQLAAWVLTAPVVASFTVMTFTGSTNFTSLSGVLREMRFAVPAQIAGAAVGLGLWLIGLFTTGGR